MVNPVSIELQMCLLCVCVCVSFKSDMSARRCRRQIDLTLQCNMRSAKRYCSEQNSVRLELLGLIMGIDPCHKKVLVQEIRNERVKKLAFV